MKTFTIAAVAWGVIWVQGAPMAQAQECGEQVAELARQVRELQVQIAGLGGGSENGETRRTTTGAVFTKAARPGFGESWRDPSGMIWGDIVKNADGSIRYMRQDQATDYCQSLGAQLPSRNDFVRLRGYIGARAGSHEEYTLVLPNLTRNVDGEDYCNFFWSSSVHPDDPSGAYNFVAHNGAGYDAGLGRVGDEAARCVARR